MKVPGNKLQTTNKLENVEVTLNMNSYHLHVKVWPFSSVTAASSRTVCAARGLGLQPTRTNRDSGSKSKLHRSLATKKPHNKTTNLHQIYELVGILLQVTVVIIKQMYGGVLTSVLQAACSKTRYCHLLQGTRTISCKHNGRRFYLQLIFRFLQIYPKSSSSETICRVFFFTETILKVLPPPIITIQETISYHSNYKKRGKLHLMY